MFQPWALWRNNQLPHLGILVCTGTQKWDLSDNDKQTSSIGCTLVLALCFQHHIQHFGHALVALYHIPAIAAQIHMVFYFNLSASILISAHIGTIGIWNPRTCSWMIIFPGTVVILQVFPSSGQSHIMCITKFRNEPSGCITTMWGPQTIAFSWCITWLTMVYGG